MMDLESSLKQSPFDNGFSYKERLAIEQLIKGTENIFDYHSVSKLLSDNGWTIHPVEHKGEIIGGILQKGPDIHTSIAPEYQKRWNPRPYINSILYPALKKYGEIKSQAAKQDQRGIRWLTKLGFEKLGEDNENYYFKLTELKFAYKETE